MAKEQGDYYKVHEEIVCKEVRSWKIVHFDTTRNQIKD